jgi:hypothetical protein
MLNIWHIKTWKFLHIFLFLGVNFMIFALLDPDPADQNQCGSGPKTLLFTGSDVSPKQSLMWIEFILVFGQNFAKTETSEKSDTKRCPKHRF